MEVTKKIHESLKKREKNNDYGICWNEWCVLWLDDTHMNNLESTDLFENRQKIGNRYLN